MTTPLIVGYNQDLTYTAAADRQIVNSRMVHGRRGTPGSTAADDGVIMGNEANFDIAASGGMGVNIAAGMAMVAGFTVVSPSTVALTAAPATAVARRDLVVLRVYDTEAGDAISKATVELVTGTTTTDPVIPLRSLIIGQVNVGANATSVTVADRRVFTASAGGVIPAWNGVSVPSQNVPPGSLVYDLSTSQYYKRTGDLALAPLIPPPVPIPPDPPVYLPPIAGRTWRTTSDPVADRSWTVYLVHDIYPTQQGWYVFQHNACWKADLGSYAHFRCEATRNGGATGTNTYDLRVSGGMGPDGDRLNSFSAGPVSVNKGDYLRIIYSIYPVNAPGSGVWINAGCDSLGFWCGGQNIT